jgi:hypothetical protein
MNIHLKNEGKECKTVPVRKCILLKRGKVNGEDKISLIWSTNFIYLYENRTMKIKRLLS